MAHLEPSEGEFYATVGKRCVCDDCPRYIAPYTCQANCGCEEDCPSCIINCHEIDDEGEIEDEE